jgi:energy-coupling factor transport system substrate-specific component
MFESLPGESNMDNRTQSQTFGLLVPVAALCIALNVGLGTIINVLKAPIYLDAIGTIAFAFFVQGTGLRGFGWSVLVGAASFAIGAILFNPVLIWFVPTQVAIAAYAYFVAGPLLRSALGHDSIGVRGYALIIVLGLLLGVVAGTVSAPIIAYLFGGITGAGASVITALLLKSGETLFTSVLLSGVASEPIDKLIQLALAVTLVRLTPSRVKAALKAR